MDFGARATIPRTENPKTKLDKQTLKFVHCNSRKPKNEIGQMVRVGATIPRTENSKTKVDIQSLKFVDTPAAENQKSKMDEYTLGLAQPFPVEANC